MQASGAPQERTDSVMQRTGVSRMTVPRRCSVGDGGEGEQASCARDALASPLQPAGTPPADHGSAGIHLANSTAGRMATSSATTGYPAANNDSATPACSPSQRWPPPSLRACD